MTLKNTFALALLGVLVLAQADGAQALFGRDKKKEKKSKTRIGDRIRSDSPEARVGPLPGMDAGGMDPAKPPAMAVEEWDAGPGMAEAPISESETAVGAYPSPDGDMPTEVVIRGTGGRKLKVNKPQLSIEVDPFESIRKSLQPDQVLLLAESPLAVVWRRTHPEFLRNGRVIKPWLTTFSERPGIVFTPLAQLVHVLQRKLTTKEARGYQWSLTVADEEGKVFQHYEGSGNPPAELTWSGQNEVGEWIQAGSAYSPVYMFTDPSGMPFTRVGKPLRFKGIVHQERTGLHVSLDSAVLFGRTKMEHRLSAKGRELVRSAADLVKRRYPGVPIRLEVYANTKSLAEQQAQAVEHLLIQELMILPQDVSIDSMRASYTGQRTEIILLNR